MSVLQSPSLTRAQDAVCGDKQVDIGEACDDGNTQSGDGCSQMCTIELCGNGVIDAGEQCDDGNTVSGDKCTNLCRKEFCGDTKIQQALGEQCDDGNAQSGDGCSSSCIDENSVKKQVPIKEEEKKILPILHPAAPLAPKKPVLIDLPYFLSPAGAELVRNLEGSSDSDKDLLRSLIGNLKKGPLSPSQRIEAERIASILASFLAGSRISLLESIHQMTTGLIANNVLSAFSIHTPILLSEDIPQIIRELKRAGISAVRDDERKSAVAGIQARLQSVHPEVTLSSEVQSKLSGESSKEALEGLVVVKKNLEQVATTDLPASYALIRTQVAAIKNELSSMKPEASDTTKLQKSLDTLIAATSDAASENTTPALRAHNAIVAELQKEGFIAKGTDTATHAAPQEEHVSVSAPTDLDLSVPVPAEYTAAFAGGGGGGMADKQRSVLKKILLDDPRIQAARQLVSKSGDTSFELRLENLLSDIDHLGSTTETLSTCDDSAAAELLCIHTYLTDLEQAAKSTGTLVKAASAIRAFFGLEQ